MSIPVDSTNSFACAGEVRPFDKSGAVSWISDPVPMSPISPSTRILGLMALKPADRLFRLPNVLFER